MWHSIDEYIAECGAAKEQAEGLQLVVNHNENMGKNQLIFVIGLIEYVIDILGCD